MLRHVASGPLSLFLSHTTDRSRLCPAARDVPCWWPDQSPPQSCPHSSGSKSLPRISFFRSLEIVCCAFSAIGWIWFWRARRRRNFDAIARPRDARGWAVAVAFDPHWRRCAALLHGGASGHAWSASRGSHRAPLRSTDIPLAFVWTLHSARACPVPQSPRTCDVAALCASTADTCAGCAPGVRTCCCWPFSVRRCLRLQRTPPSAIPLSTCSSSVSCACHGVHRSRRWLGGSCHGGRTRLPSQLD